MTRYRNMDPRFATFCFNLQEHTGRLRLSEEDVTALLYSADSPVKPRSRSKAVRELFNGRRPPNRATLAVLADRFGITTKALLGDSKLARHMSPPGEGPFARPRPNGHAAPASARTPLPADIEAALDLLREAVARELEGRQGP